MIFRSLLILSFGLLWGCNTRPVSIGAWSLQAKCVAVLPFEVRYDAESYDEIFSEFVSLEFEKKYIKTLGPTQIANAYRASGQVLSPSIDVYWAKKLAQDMNVDAVIFGQVSRVPIETSEVSAVSQTIRGTQFIQKRVTRLLISIEVFMLDTWSGHIRWTYGDRKELDIRDSIDWLSVTSQKMVDSLFSDVKSPNRKMEACGRLPVAVAQLEKPATKAKTSTNLPLTSQQEKIKRSLDDTLRLPHSIFQGRTMTLTQEGDWLLKDVAQVLLSDPKIQLYIVGHIDGTQQTAEDLELSKSRALVVQSTFVKAGVEASRLSFVGEGGTRPIVPNLYEKSRELNRRTELKRKKI